MKYLILIFVVLLTFVGCGRLGDFRFSGQAPTESVSLNSPTHVPSVPLGCAIFLPGDANRDGCVMGDDYTIWADHYHQSVATGTPNYQVGDFNSDGYVDGADYTLWADNFKKCCN